MGSNMSNMRSSFQSLVWSMMTPRRSFWKSFALSKKAWMQRFTSVGSCKSLDRSIKAANCPNTWSMSSWEWPLLKQLRAAARMVRLLTKELKYRIFGEFLLSLQVLSLWILTCKSRRFAPCSCSTVSECEINSMEALESLWRNLKNNVECRARARMRARCLMHVPHWWCWDLCLNAMQLNSLSHTSPICCLVWIKTIWKYKLRQNLLITPG